MLDNLSVHKKVWGLITALSSIAAVVGILYDQFYNRVVSDEILPGVISQDILTVPVLLMVITLVVKLKTQIRIQIHIPGYPGYLFYACGIFVIERLYRPLYLLYMAIFALSFYALNTNSGIMI